MNIKYKYGVAAVTAVDEKSHFFTRSLVVFSNTNELSNAYDEKADVLF